MGRRRLVVGVLVVLAAGLAFGVAAAGHAAPRLIPCVSRCLVEIGVDGKGQRYLLRDAPPVADVSGDWARILIRRDSNLSIAPVQGDGPERRLATDLISRAAFSPDGRLVAYDRTSPAPDPQSQCEGSDVGVVGVDGSGARRAARCAFAPTWAPDSRRLAFVTDIGSTSGVFTVADAAGAGPHAIDLWETSFGSGNPLAAWAPNGALLAVTTASLPDPPQAHGGFAGGSIRRGYGLQQIDVVRPGGGRVWTLAHAASPAWAPDGRRFAFLNEDGSLWVADITTRKTRIVRREFYAGDVSWSPAGDLLGFLQEGELDVVRPDGTGLRQLSPKGDNGGVTRFFWSRDGRRALYLVEA